MKRVSDICPAPPRVHSFMVARAIQNEVDREDLIRWASTPTVAELPAYEPEPYKPITRATLYVFVRGILP